MASKSYNLAVIVNYKNIQNVCFPGMFSDTETLSFSIPLTSPISLESNQFKNLGYSIYPNPISDNLKIDFGTMQQNVKLTLQNMQGQFVFTRSFENVNNLV